MSVAGRTRQTTPRRFDDRRPQGRGLPVFTRYSDGAEPGISDNLNAAPVYSFRYGVCRPVPFSPPITEPMSARNGNEKQPIPAPVCACRPSRPAFSGAVGRFSRSGRGAHRNASVQPIGARFAANRGSLNGRLNAAPFVVRVKVSRADDTAEVYDAAVVRLRPKRSPEQPLSLSDNRHDKRAPVACVRLILPFFCTCIDFRLLLEITNTRTVTFQWMCYSTKRR